MSTPVSWFLIEPGWRVESADGASVGKVDEVEGEPEADIFDGLRVSGRYVPAEEVGEIVEGRVSLKIDRSAFEALG